MSSTKKNESRPSQPSVRPTPQKGKKKMVQKAGQRERRKAGTGGSRAKRHRQKKRHQTSKKELIGEKKSLSQRKADGGGRK